MKRHCHHCGGLIRPGLHWEMFTVLYCKLCRRIVEWVP
jgi:hypothetical protein